MDRRTFVSLGGGIALTKLTGCLSGDPETSADERDDADSAPGSTSETADADEESDGGDEEDAAQSDDARDDEAGDDQAADEQEEDDEADEQSESEADEAARAEVDFETVPLRATIEDGEFRVDDVTGRIGFASTATEDSPATVEVVLTNEGDAERTVGPAELPALDQSVRNERTASYAALLPLDDHALATTTADAELVDGRWVAPSTDEGWLPDEITIAPGESVAGRFALVETNTDDVPGLVLGRYEFDRDGRTVSLSLERTDEPGPDVASRFEGEEVPPLPIERSARWYHEATPESLLYVEPETESETLPAEIDFTTVNEALGPAGGNKFEWGIYKLVDGEWFRVGPHAVPTPSHEIEPGEQHTNTVTLVEDYAPFDDSHQYTLGPIGGGRYAYHDGFGRTTGPIEGYNAALFEIDAPVIEIEPDDDLAVEREDDRVVVTTPAYDESDDGVALTLERTDDADDRVIAEQVYSHGYRSLWNALPYFEDGVETVELRTSDDAVGLRFRNSDRFRFRGEAYEATLDEAPE